MTTFRERLPRHALSVGVGMILGGIMMLAVPAGATSVRTATSDGAFPMNCTLVGSHISCDGDLPTASPTAPPTTAPPTTTPPVTTPPPTTVPPTTVPPTTPASIGSFATGPAGGSGVPAGTVLTPFAGNVVSGTTYTNRSFTSLPITVAASNITLRNCSLPRGVIFTGNGVTVDHCTIHGGVSLSGGDNFIFTSNNVTGWDDGLHITSDSGPVVSVTVLNNWIHAPTPACSDHSDGVQVLGVRSALFRGNVIDLGTWIPCGPLNGAFQFENTQGPVSAVRVTGNLLNGGGYVFRAYAGTQLDAVTGNGFGPDEHWGPNQTLESTIGTWSGNFFTTNGAPVARA